MKEAYNDIMILAKIEHINFAALNIAHEKFQSSVPNHSHGNNSYELHYIPSGFGMVYIEGVPYEVTPNTLYVTGPHVEHEQIPLVDNPMIEYSIYFKLSNGPTTGNSTSCKESIAEKFRQVHFWFGKDSQNLFPLMQKLFQELSNEYTGYMLLVETIITQIVVAVVRNYEKVIQSKIRFAPSNLGISKYLIVEESFLYNYETITLESLAEALGLSTRQTERFLKTNYGKSFREKKAEAKMSVAKVLLQDKSLFISTIAEKLNYSSVQHFSYAFNKHFGLTPSKYRKEKTNPPK